MIPAWLAAVDRTQCRTIQSVAARYRQRCAGSKGHAWFVRELRGARLAGACRRAPPSVRVTPAKAQQLGGNRPLHGRCSHNAAFRQIARFTTLCFVLWCDPGLRRTLRVDGAAVMSCASARLPNHRVRIKNASSGRRRRVRAHGSYGRALPSVSMNAQLNRYRFSIHSKAVRNTAFAYLTGDISLIKLSPRFGL